MRSQAGQATVEWVGLVLLAALALGALAAFRPSGSDLGLGEALAGRIGRGPAADASRLRTPAAPRVRAAPRPRAAPRGRAAPPRAKRLSGASELGKGLWIVCLGYRRYVYERENPRAPNEPMPLDELLELADSCFNPLGFLKDD